MSEIVTLGIRVGLLINLGVGRVNFLLCLVLVCSPDGRFDVAVVERRLGGRFGVLSCSIFLSCP